jgi:hypothetical protein
VWRYRQQVFALAKRLAYVAKLAVLKITESTVNQSSGPARRSAGDVSLIKQQHLQPAHGSIAGDASAVYAPSDNKKIIGLIFDCYWVDSHRRWIQALVPLRNHQREGRKRIDGMYRINRIERRS